MGREVRTGDATYINKDFFLANKDMKKLVIDKALESFTGVIGFQCKELEFIEVDSANPRYASEDGILYTKDFKTLIRYPSGKDGRAVRLRESVLTLLDNSFSHIARLHEFYTGPHLCFVSYDTFNGCSRLESIHIGRKVVNFPVSATTSCWNLKEFLVDEENSTYSSYDGCLYTKDKKLLLRVPVGHGRDVKVPYEDIAFSQHCLMQWKGSVNYITEG